MRLRNVELGDVDAYVRMRCDPVMMAELGGPLPREGIEEKVASDAKAAADDISWIVMVVPDEQRPDEVAGGLALWGHVVEGESLSEIGWMVLPAFQGRGIAKRSVRMLLDRADADGRWGPIHAFPAVGNGPSNGICRSLGFTHVAARDLVWADRQLRVNHWRYDPA